jgi:ABC-type transport system substrate-binding protein
MLKKANEELTARAGGNAWLDLSRYPLPGVEVVDDYTYRVRLKGPYPQFLYWLAMPFFAPVPLEVDRFFAQPGMTEKNLTLD